MNDSTAGAPGGAKPSSHVSSSSAFSTIPRQSSVSSSSSFLKPGNPPPPPPSPISRFIRSLAEPKVPTTPSQTINEMLESRCGRRYDNPLKSAVAAYICLMFTAITLVYTTIHGWMRPAVGNTDTAPPASHTHWMLSCALVSSAVAVKVWLLYALVLAVAPLVHLVLYYLALALVLFAVGLGVAGATFFDKRASEARKYY